MSLRYPNERKIEMIRNVIKTADLAKEMEPLLLAKGVKKTSTSTVWRFLNDMNVRHREAYAEAYLTAIQELIRNKKKKSA